MSRVHEKGYAVNASLITEVPENCLHVILTVKQNALMIVP